MRNKFENLYENYGCGWLIFIVIIALGLAFGIMCFEGWILMLVWNALLPSLWAAAPILSFWQCVGIVFLLDLIGSLLFKRGSRD
jgi:hypothetical protein